MVDKKISELPDAGAAASADTVPIVQNSTSTTKKLTIGAILTLLLAGILGGKVLIGGTGVTDKLVFQGTAGNGTLTAPSIQMNVGNNGATTAMTILNSGNVGIGTTAPSVKLEVNGNVKASGGSANKVMCWKSDAKTLGYCSDAPASDGGCTCN